MSVIPTGEFLQGYKRYIKYKCTVCGYEGTMRRDHYNNGIGCSVCSGKIVLKGYNDIATTSPEIAKYIHPKEDAYRYTKFSSKKLTFKCDICGYERVLPISSVTRHGKFVCPVCDGCGISYPNRFMTSILFHFGIKFETEKTFEWSNGKRYDFYIQKYNMIIEMNGQQHYVNKRTFGTTSLAEIQSNDAYKVDIAKKNGITSYISVPLFDTTPEAIIKSITDNMVLEKIGIECSDEDWKAIVTMSSRKLPKECLELWESGIRSTEQIANKLHITPASVSSYLKQYALRGICDYDAKVQRHIGRKFAQEARKRKIICETNNMIFDSINEASSFAGVTPNAIQNCLAGRCGTSGKDSNNNRLKWKYL